MASNTFLRDIGNNGGYLGLRFLVPIHVGSRYTRKGEII